jgi:hypothetical protein
VVGDWRRQHNEDDEMGDSCSTHWRDEKSVQKFWSENLKVRDQSEDLHVDGRIILEWILVKYIGKVWTGFIWLRIGTSGGLL